MKTITLCLAILGCGFILPWAAQAQQQSAPTSETKSTLPGSPIPGTEGSKIVDPLSFSESLVWKTPKGFSIADFVVSNDGKHFAYRNEDSIVVDGIVGRTYKWVGSPIFSPDGRSVAYAASLGGDTVVVLNGTEGQRYKEVGTVLYDTEGRRNVFGLKFSPDSKRLAYVAVTHKNKQILVVDGTEGTEYDSIGDFVFSGDGRQFAYAAKRGRAWVLVLDGKERNLGEGEISGLEFGPESAQLAYVSRQNKVEDVTVGEIKGTGFDRVSRPFFSADGKRVAYMAKRGAKKFIVSNGAEGKQYDWVGHPCFSPDGKRVAYAASQGGFLDGKILPNLRYKSRGATYAIVADGIEGAWFDGPLMPWIQYSPDGSRVAYWVFRSNKWHLMVDQAESFESETLGTLVFSPDSKRLANTASKDPKKKKTFVVVDSVAQKEYDSVMDPAFSPDSRHLIYVAGLAGKTFLVVDGQEAMLDKGFRSFRGATYTFSAVDLDSGIETTVQEQMGFAFESPSVFNALALKGDEVYRIRMEIAH